MQIKRNAHDLFPCSFRIGKGPGDTRKNIVELFRKGGQNLALATVFRDRQSLLTEAEMEAAYQRGPRQ